MTTPILPGGVGQDGTGTGNYFPSGSVPVGGQILNPTVGQPGYVAPAINTNNPVSSSTGTRAGYTALGNDISTFANSAGLTAYNDKATKLLNDRMDQMKSDYESDYAGIKTAYEEANKIQTDRQGKDYAGRATGLITSGGGFLGTTQSHEGVLQNLTDTFTQEKNALMAKRDAALQAARSAYDDKAFAVAMENLKVAKETEQTLYDRQKDFADQQLQLAKESRAQKEFDIGMTDKKVAAYAAMSDAEFKAQNPADIAALDAQYYPGYTKAAREIAVKARDLKTKADATDLDVKILDARAKIPMGQKFVINGQTYTGLKEHTSGGGTEADRKAAAFSKISEILSGKLNTDGNQLYTIPGTKGVPYTDAQGYLTPEGWLYSVKNFGVDAKDLIDNYSHLFNPKYLENYQLSEVQKNLIRPKL